VSNGYKSYVLDLLYYDMNMNMVRNENSSE